MDKSDAPGAVWTCWEPDRSHTTPSTASICEHGDGQSSRRSGASDAVSGDCKEGVFHEKLIDLTASAPMSLCAVLPFDCNICKSKCCNGAQMLQSNHQRTSRLANRAHDPRSHLFGPNPAMLTGALWIPYVVSQVMTNGFLTRENYTNPAPRKVPLWGDRANRAHINAVESLAPFAVLVIIAHLSGQAP